MVCHQTFKNIDDKWVFPKDVIKVNDKFLTTRKGFSKYYGRVTKTGGVILLLTGVLIATNQIQVISYYILTIFPFLTTLG